MSNEKMVAALLRERAALLSVGKTERAAEVDEQLRLHGYEEAPIEETSQVPPRPVDPKRQAPKGRTSRQSPNQT